jgi:hypothetical protein
MTTVPNDPVATPPEGEPNADPGAPQPAEDDPVKHPEPSDDEQELAQGRLDALRTEIPPEPPTKE